MKVVLLFVLLLLSISMYVRAVPVPDTTTSPGVTTTSDGSSTDAATTQVTSTEETSTSSSVNCNDVFFLPCDENNPNSCFNCANFACEFVTSFNEFACLPSGGGPRVK
ncbi:uncharacterized protein LOC130644451 [Hydractinia symbiolongicarpus]|uniref:uncharacterized protein LOC130644451 n=1 Tax=Hydractinia symbiolongicarpus TaxID=13093 RepID=UPI00254BC80F|nr:uncharacterized protein LOC130644451 [Hydractinia symbiolongicarpus]XP_057306049.1 uncharacterized protein LOC130644451 [Hydractinia symbiolongicarpus]XP_057306050.1 uncharacterized protein LOC130644451 [Hydractinia symbiolongicarpus]